MHNKLIVWIFAIILLMAAIVIAVSLADTVPNAGGVAHPEFNGMQIGGDGAARLQHIGGLASAFHALLILLIISFAVLGVNEERRDTRFWAYMGCTLLFSLFVWWRMHAEHQAFIETGVTSYFMGFPVATAFQLFGTWLSSIPLTIIYCLGFRKYIFTEEDERKFEQLLAESEK